MTSRYSSERISLDLSSGQRCAGRNFQGRRCCTPEQPCGEGEGDCDGPADGGQHDGHAGCKGDLVCGSNNCLQFGLYYHPKDDCCERLKPVMSSGTQRPSRPFNRGEKCSLTLNGRRGKCCSPSDACGEGEGDCDSDSDCQPGLVCGQNNCKQFGPHYHTRDDCCERPNQTSPPLEPGSGQRCAGRNYPGGRRCCTPEQPCGEGEGDCDGPGDGGQHDGHAGCKGDLMCGSNNCLQFGLYYHPKDDCCEWPSVSTPPPKPHPGAFLEPPPGRAEGLIRTSVICY